MLQVEVQLLSQIRNRLLQPLKVLETPAAYVSIWLVLMNVHSPYTDRDLTHLPRLSAHLVVIRALAVLHTG